MYKKLFEQIEKYEHIVLYRHVNPDFDAFGSQIGLYLVLKEHYKNKKFYLAGSTKSYAYSMFIDCYDQQMPNFNSDKVLGIVLDTANTDRIDDESYKQCDFLVKIDHHIVVEQYGHLNYEIETASSCSEIIGLILLENKEFNVSKEAARSIYIGIVGDSNRFMYDCTSKATFLVASFLMECGVDLKTVYQPMYQRSLEDLKIQGYILSKFIHVGKIAYYVMDTEDLSFLNIDREVAASFVNVFSGIAGIEVWLAVTKNEEEQNYRVRIRSKNVAINEIAAKYDGGGHALASGATITDLAQLELLLNDIKEVI